MLKNFFGDHHFKLLLSAPIIFLVIFATNSPYAGNIFLLQTTGDIFLTVGEETPIALQVLTKSPINVIGGTVTFSSATLEVASITRAGSLIDLWSEEPTYSNQEGTIQFSGGIVGEKSTAITNGDVLTVNMRMKNAGVGVVSITNAQLLASNGEGTNIVSGHNTLIFYVREPGAASPDVNNDGVLTIADVNMLYLKSFRSYDSRYDLNADKKINWADVKELIALF